MAFACMCGPAHACIIITHARTRPCAPRRRTGPGASPASSPVSPSIPAAPPPAGRRAGVMPPSPPPPPHQAPPLLVPPFAPSPRRRTDVMPPPPQPTKHHPSSVDLELIKRLAVVTPAKTLRDFLRKEFAAINADLAGEEGRSELWLCVCCCARVCVRRGDEPCPHECRRPVAFLMCASHVDGWVGGWTDGWVVTCVSHVRISHAST